MRIFSFLKKELILKILGLVFAFLLCFSCISPAFSVNNTLTPSTESRENDDKKSDAEESSEKEKDDDKSEDNDKTNPTRDKGEKPILGKGETGILVDAASGRVLFEKDSNKKMYPASTTKIMTALLAIEAVKRGELSMDTRIEITHEMLSDADPEGTNMALVVGEVISLKDLLRGLMIPSGNDAASAIAMYVGKSVATFVDTMNVRAIELGAENTNFINPHGLHDDEHYTTAADMAKISCEAMKHSEFRNIVDIAHVKIPPTNKKEDERYYINTNGLLSTMRYTDFFYKGSIGIKTGYTSNAGNCLVSAASKSGMELIGVIFGGESTSDSHKDSAELLDWGFEEHASIVALQKNDMPCEIKVKQGKGVDSLTLSVPTSLNVTVPKDITSDALEIRPNVPEAIYAPIAADEKIGTVSVLLDGVELGSCDLIANKSIERSIFWPVMALGEWLWSKTFVRIICYACIAAVTTFILLFIVGIYRNLKKAKRRRSRRR